MRPPPVGGYGKKWVTKRSLTGKTTPQIVTVLESQPATLVKVAGPGLHSTSVRLPEQAWDGNDWSHFRSWQPSQGFRILGDAHGCEKPLFNAIYADASLILVELSSANSLALIA
jgi:hypothetical protein